MQDKIDRPERVTANDQLWTMLNGGEIFAKISDIMRLVDPLQKRVIEHHNKEIAVTDLHCFDFWGNNKVCDNCISMRAYHDNVTYVKMEYTSEKAYLITAVPHELDGRRVVLEILKDITDSVYFNSFETEGTERTAVQAVIEAMNRVAFSDSLTGLYNRRYISEKLPVDLLNTGLISKEMSVMMVDIDFFKSVNDRYGHLAGDQTLKAVAELLSGCMQRGSDWIARYGGEEFLVCMPGADLAVAKARAEFMRKSLEDSFVRFEGNDIRVTASFGIYSFKPTGHDEIDALLKHADDRLYRAKKNGRNRVEYEDG